MNFSEKQYPYLVAFHRLMNLTFRRFETLQKVFDSDFEKAWKAPLQELLNAGIDSQALEKLESRSAIDPELEYEKIQSCGAKVCIYGQDNYPFPLLNISSPPAILFVKGKIIPSDFPAIAMVGSRGITQYGKRVVTELATDFVKAEITIVSGLAYGVDVLSHKTALKNGGRTIAVLGNGIDHIYPSEHQSFAQEMIDSGRGVLISEYLPGVEARPEYFPVRNRIVSGLSKGVIIMEARKKSGSLITAETALQQNKEVFSVPGSIFSPQSEGTNYLLSQGATPAVSSEFILQELGLQPSKKIQRNQESINEIEKEVLLLFGNEIMVDVDQLHRRSSLSASQLNAQLLIMEMKGFLEKSDGGKYVRK